MHIFIVVNLKERTRVCWLVHLVHIPVLNSIDSLRLNPVKQSKCTAIDTICKRENENEKKPEERKKKKAEPRKDASKTEANLPSVNIVYPL